MSSMLSVMLRADSPEGRTPRSVPPGSRLPRSNVHAIGLELVGLELATGPGEGLPSPGDLHVHEPGPGDRVDELSLQESAADSGRPDFHVVPCRRRNVT